VTLSAKAQLVQLQNAKTKFEAQGLKLPPSATQSRYPEGLCQRTNRVPLIWLTPNSEIIRTFNVLNIAAKED